MNECRKTNDRRNVIERRKISDKKAFQDERRTKVSSRRQPTSRRKITNEYRETDNNQHNSIYYNQMMRASEKKSPRRRVKEKSFAAKKVDLSNYLIIPKGYEGIAYALYILAIPYIVGITFLFFYVAKGAYSNFSLLDVSSFLIVWAIGYEITGAIILLFIFFAFLKHLKYSES